VGVSISNYQKSANFNYFNPYYTLDGISRGFNAYFRRLDFDERNIARYSTDAIGLGMTFGFPIGETQRLSFGGLIEQTEITAGQYPAQEITTFIDENGDNALNFKLNASWTSSSLNRGLFPTRGRSHQVLSSLYIVLILINLGDKVAATEIYLLMKCSIRIKNRESWIS
jgi:outer membrane protein insertion porin family